jgi:hypothetical protein
VPVWLGHLLLALATCALAAAAVRVASPIAPRGLVRLLAAAPLAFAAAVVEALGLGLVGAGGSPGWLTPAAVATWALVRVLAPRPAYRLRDELVDWWRGLHREWRLVAGAVAGLFAAYVAFLLRYPDLGFDGVVYHLPEVVLWVQGGHPGSVVTTIQGLPVGAYPVTDEVALAWATGIAGSLVPLTVFTPLTLVLLLVAGVVGLRALRVPGWALALALAALVVQPLVVAQLGGPNTDLPALAWLACEAALCAAALTARPRTAVVVLAQPGGYAPGAPVPPGAGGPAPARPPRALLLVPALVAFLLAVGTKTTVAPLGLVLLAAAGWDVRRELRPVLAPLAGALALGLLAGGVWYLRNLFEHGSPLWPFLAAPWGTAEPRVVADVSDSLLSRPAATLGHGHLSGYVTELAGGVVLLAGGIAAALANRRAAVAAAATALSVLAWAAAPVTGVSRLPELGAIAVSALRYLLPALACGAAALALAALGPRRAAKAGAGVLLGAALVWGIVRDAEVGFPVVPSATTLVIGVVVGALIAWAAGWLLVRVPLVATAVMVALALALAAPGYLDRHGQASTAFDPGVSRFLAAQPGYGDGDAPVALAPSMAGPLAGDRVRHRLSLLRTGTSCAAVRRAARSGYVVLRAVRSIELQRRPRAVFPAPVTARACLAPARPIYARNGVEVYALR